MLYCQCSFSSQAFFDRNGNFRNTRQTNSLFKFTDIRENDTKTGGKQKKVDGSLEMLLLSHFPARFSPEIPPRLPYKCYCIHCIKHTECLPSGRPLAQESTHVPDCTVLHMNPYQKRNGKSQQSRVQIDRIRKFNQMNGIIVRNLEMIVPSMTQTSVLLFRPDHLTLREICIQIVRYLLGSNSQVTPRGQNCMSFCETQRSLKNNPPKRFKPRILSNAHHTTCQHTPKERIPRKMQRPFSTWHKLCLIRL